jgi:hypothetical protein
MHWQRDWDEKAAREVKGKGDTNDRYMEDDADDRISNLHFGN